MDTGLPVSALSRVVFVGECMHTCWSFLMCSTTHQTPAEMGEAAASKAAAGDWRAPDLSLKAHKGHLSAAAKQK